MNRKTGWLVGVGLLVVLVGGYLWIESSTRPQAADLPDTGVRSVAPDTVSQPILGGALEPASDVGEMASPSAMSEAAGAADGQGEIPTVGDILADPDEDYVRVAKKLLAITLNPRAPREEREEALAHALNLSAGNEAEVLTPLIKDPNLPDDFADTILDEALNRPLSYQADLYLAALAVRKTPEMQTKIREHLAFLTDSEDKGPDPAAWAEAVRAAKKAWEE